MFSHRHPVLDFRTQLIYTGPSKMPEDPSKHLPKGATGSGAAIGAMQSASQQGPISPQMLQQIVEAAQVGAVQHVHQGVPVPAAQAQGHHVQQQVLGHPMSDQQYQALMGEIHRIAERQQNLVRPPAAGVQPAAIQLPAVRNVVQDNEALRDMPLQVTTAVNLFRTALDESRATWTERERSWERVRGDLEAQLRTTAEQKRTQAVEAAPQNMGSSTRRPRPSRRRRT